MSRQMSSGLFVVNTGHHAASWRDPDTAPDPTVRMGAALNSQTRPSGIAT